jgi:hypothetical protein
VNRRRPLHELPVKTCRLYPHRCCVCLGDIGLGERYHDGGWPRRAHVGCAQDVAQAPLGGLPREHTRAELDELDKRELAAARARGETRRRLIEDLEADAVAPGFSKGKR